MHAVSKTVRHFFQLIQKVAPNKRYVEMTAARRFAYFLSRKRLKINFMNFVAYMRLHKTHRCKITIRCFTYTYLNLLYVDVCLLMYDTHIFNVLFVEKFGEKFRRNDVINSVPTYKQHVKCICRKIYAANTGDPNRF